MMSDTDVVTEQEQVKLDFDTMIEEMKLDEVEDPVAYLAKFMQNSGDDDSTQEPTERDIQAAKRLLDEVGYLDFAIGVLIGYYDV